ncbi:hypothetical protein FOL46_003721, partial [Perkinsus olseni]
KVAKTGRTSKEVDSHDQCESHVTEVEQTVSVLQQVQRAQARQHQQEHFAERGSQKTHGIFLRSPKVNYSTDWGPKMAVERQQNGPNQSRVEPGVEGDLITGATDEGVDAGATDE